MPDEAFVAPEVLPLTEPWSVPLQAHPAALYLRRLAPSGRRSQGVGLDRIARWASRGALGWRELPWHELGYRHAANIVGWLLETFRTPATCNAYRAALRGVMRECWRLGYLDAEGLAKILDLAGARGSRSLRGRALAGDELAALLCRLVAQASVVAVRDAAFIAVAYSSGGVRLEEALSVTMDDVDRDDRSIRIIGKGNKERRIWLSDEAMEGLDAWLRVRLTGPGPLFVPVDRDRTTLHFDRRLAQSTMRAMCVRRAREAGIARFTPHDLRRTSISDLIDDTGDIALVSGIAGHSNLNTTARYDRRPEAARRRAARTLHLPYPSANGR